MNYFNIITIKIYCYLVFYSKNFVISKQLKFKHGTPETYMISLRNNIQNFNCLLAVTQIQMDMNTSGMKTLVISVYKRCGVVLFKGAAYFQKQR